MEQDIFNLSGKVTLITGAGGGLGRSMAMGIAHYGANMEDWMRIIDVSQCFKYLAMRDQHWC